jgi:gliding motility-associated-like protein
MLAQATAQTTYLMNNNSPVNDCNGSFYDSGGPTGDYANNQNFTKTFCSDGTDGTHISLSFSGIGLGAGDLLCFYDGSNTSAPLLACSDDYPPGQPFLVQATAANPGGCLTVTFVSDGNSVGSGWAAAIRCVKSCQTVLSEIISTTPALLPADTGWIDVCPGERIFFKGRGIYPQDGLSYPQSDLTTTFEWNFGDGSIGYGPNSSHRFTEPGGYYVQLLLQDVEGCRSTNLVNLRVRVAGRPSFDITQAIDQAICAGDTIQLGASVASDSNSILVVAPSPGTFAIEASRSDSLPLPDGTGVPYETSIFFTEFSPGQTVTGPTDIESICIDIEHSWMRDMRIRLTCPNGDTIGLHNFGGQNGGQVFLGEPNDPDDPNDPSTISTPWGDVQPGEGYQYCWTMSANNGTWLEYANIDLGGSGTLPSGDYQPYDPFSDLIGCPLNGEWKITVTDLWPIDNGFLFNWSIKLREDLYPSIETFTPQLIDWGWNNHPSIFYETQDSIAAAPQNAGTANYTFQVTDEFGCAWDQAINIPVLPKSHPDCHTCADDFVMLRDSAVCFGESVPLDASPLFPVTEEVRFESYPDYRFGNANHPHNNPYISKIAVNSLGYPILTNPATQITSVCVDVETDFDADINLYLRSPDGKTLELSTGNGGGGDNYKVTCFSPSAATPVTAGTAPFNGTFRPEGNWNALQGAAMDGDWQLLVSDGFGINQYGRVKGWSIGFVFDSKLQYTWTNTSSLSCANCPTPTATPTAPTIYQVTAQDLFGCTHRDTVQIDITAYLPPPTGLFLANIAPGGSMTWTWNPIPNVVGYEVQINGGAWMPASGNLSHTVTGLTSGDIVLIRVRAVNNNPNCVPDNAADVGVYVECILDAYVNNTDDVTCAGKNNGSAFVSASFASPPLQYYVNGVGTAYVNGDLVNIFGGGNHFVVVQDATGCRDTAYFSIAEPPPLDLSATSTTALCNGENSGALNASSTGGSGAVSFSWQNCLGGSITTGAAQVNLFAGCYQVTAVDANGCRDSLSITVDEPAAMMFTSSQDSVDCSGLTNGTATISVSGGTAPYTYQWDNGQTTATATGLDADFHSVVVKDSIGCKAATLVQVLEPALLSIDSLVLKAVTCAGANNGTANILVQGGTKPYKYAWSNTQTTQKANNLAPGTYTVTVSDFHGCSVVVSANIGSPSPILVDFTGISLEKCAADCNAKATIAPSGGTPPYTLDWGLPNVPAGAYTATTLCAGEYIVTVTDGKGCTETNKLTIAPTTPLDLKYNTTPPTCQGQINGSVQSSVSGGATPYQYLWSNGQSNATVQNVGCGPVFLTLTDANGCVVSDTVFVDCPAVIVVQQVLPQPVRCFGESNGQINVAAQGGLAPLTYQWSDPNGQATATATGLSVGTYTVTITDGNGCKATATGSVTQPDLLTAPLTALDVVCFGENSGSVTASPQGGTAPYTYTWPSGPGQQVLSELSAGTYTVTVVDARQCSVINSSTVQQPALPLDLSVIQEKQACFGASDGIAKATASGGNGGPFSYLWSNTSSGSSIGGLSPGAYQVTASDVKGCTSAAAVSINTLEAVEVNVSFTPPTCFGKNDARAAINFLSGGLGQGDTTQYSYAWNIAGAGSVTRLTNLFGNKTYGVTVSDAQGCSGEFSFFVPEPPALEILFSVKNATCYGYSDGEAAITQVLNAAAPLTYSWSTGKTSAEVTGLSQGIYTVRIEDAKACLATTSVPVSAPDLLEASLTAGQLVCAGDTDAYLEASTTGGTPTYAYTWSSGATASKITDLPPGTYSLTVADQNACTTIVTQTILDPAPLLISLANEQPYCFGESTGRIKVIAQGGKKPYQYQLNELGFGSSSTFLALPAGDYAVAVRDANGCANDTTFTLTAPPPLDVSLWAADSTLILGDSTLLLPNVGNAVGTVSYAWNSSFLEALPCIDSTCSSVWARPVLSTTYTVIVTDETGCTGTGSVEVSIEKPRGVFVPSGFSPNGDSNNDLLHVHGKGEQIRAVRLFRVYDRWGELVYEDSAFKVNDLNRGWDGRFRGKECPPGVYVWLAEVEYIDGFIDVARGDVTLLR